VPRYSTIGETWTDGKPCKRVPPETKCRDARGNDVGPFLFAETETGIVGYKHPTKNDPTHAIPDLAWKVCPVPLTIDQASDQPKPA
jgi:hypothetical protein